MIESHYYWMLLNHIYGIGPKTLNKIYRISKKQNISITGFFLLSENELKNIYKFKPVIITKIKSHKKLHKKIFNLIRDLKEKDIKIISIDDEDYPDRLLKHLKYPPTVLYLYGNLDLLKKETSGIFASRAIKWKSIFATTEICKNVINNRRPLVVGTSKEIYEYASYIPKKMNGENIIVVNFGIYDIKLKSFAEEFRTLSRLIDIGFDKLKNLVISFVNPEYGWSISTEKEKNDIIFALSDIAYGIEVRKNGIIYNNFIKAVETEKHLYIALFNGLTKNNSRVHKELIEIGCNPYIISINENIKNVKVDWRILKKILEENSDLKI